MDGRRISDLRTGASAAIFARYLAVSPLNEILVVGAGVQGMNAIQCLLLEYPDSLIRVYDINKEKAELLKENFPANSKKKIIVSDNLEEATKSSKLIALLTTSQKPFLKNEWISPGATVLGMGTYQQIFEDFTLSADKIVPDSWVQAVGRGELKSLFNAGKITQKNCFSEIGKIATGFSKGRENDEERILGLPVGIGAHDVCMAYKIYNEAVKNQEGVWIELQ
jgi:ornithine cyclodeaminase/alanine dehydrogenase-like protein (mu-crystallin family)